MSRVGTPVLILSVADADGQVIEDPLFVAVAVTEALCSRLRAAAGLCRRHQLSQLGFRHEGSPPFWDPSGGRLAGISEHFAEWTIAEGCASVALCVRRSIGAGAGAKFERVASSQAVAIDQLKALPRRDVDDLGLVVAVHEEWTVDDRFEVEVLVRIARLRRSGTWCSAE